MFIENFSNFIKCYGKGRKLKLFGFLILSLAAGFLEFVGISLIYPFILLIIKPQSIIHTKYYADFTTFLHIHNIHNTLICAFALGFLVTLVFIAKNLFMIFTLYLQNKFTNNWKLAIGKQFMHYYLFSPYKNSLETSPSEKLYNLTFLIDQSIEGFIFRIINLVTNLAIVVMILTLLFMKFLFAALVTSAFIILAMVFQSRIFKKKVAEIAQKRLKVSAQNNEKTQENIHNIKEIKILSAENYFYEEYAASQQKISKITCDNNFYMLMPQYVIEIFVVLALLLLGGIVSLQNIYQTSWMIASYAVIAAAIFRIAPALNRIQTAITSINTSRDFTKTMILECKKIDFDFVEEKSVFKLEFKNSIKLKNICFAYKKAEVIKNLNLEIKKGEFVGIIGLSGAGKSTLADIIMGLLPIDSGEIFVDNVGLNQKNFSALRKLIGYVPQQINILDGSFKRNVGYGLPEVKIDDTKVINALKKAQLYDVVERFEEGINAKVIVGAAGLSQGQKQRLAIARVLYRNPEILILDEATSSLDLETENEITQMLTALKGETTIIAIAHRLSTLKSCDRLIYLKKGEIVDTGTFEELSAKHPDFNKLIKLSQIGLE
jgi:ATP-binding cassette, subfamily B, bacterial PglK